MAKKNKKEETDENYEFVPPSFNEKEFLGKEMSSAKMTAFTFAMGIIGGVVAFIVTIFLGLVAGFVGGMIIGTAILAIPKIMGPTEKPIKWTQWAGNSLTYLITVMAIMAITTNPPFMDFSEPNITSPQWYITEGDDWSGISQIVYTGANNTTVDITFRIRAIDNSAEDLEVMLRLDNNPEIPMKVDDTGYLYYADLVLTQNDHTITVTATDNTNNVYFPHAGDGPYTKFKIYVLDVVQGEPPEE